MLTFTIRLPGRIDTTLRPNVHKHWRTKWRAQSDAHDLGYAYSWMYRKFVAPEGVAEDGFRYDVTIGMAKRQNRMDDDNAVACLKHYLDGIAAGLEVDDRWFRLGTVEQVRDPEGIGYIEFRLTEITGESEAA